MWNNFHKTSESILSRMTDVCLVFAFGLWVELLSLVALLEYSIDGKSSVFMQSSTLTT